eukprot:g3304.t1
MVGYEAENALLLQEVENATASGEKQFVPDEIRTQIFRKLRARQENRTCFDCPARNPTWISLSHGCYVCLVCSGEHRRMGVHISFVRSVELDSFNKEQLVQMIIGGNGKCRHFLKSIGIEGKRKDADGSGRKVDYYDKSTLKYRQQLERETHSQCKAMGIDVAASATGGSGTPKNGPQASSVPQPAEPIPMVPVGAQPSGGGGSQPANAEDLASELFKGFGQPSAAAGAVATPGQPLAPFAPGANNTAGGATSSTAGGPGFSLGGGGSTGAGASSFLSQLASSNAAGGSQQVMRTPSYTAPEVVSDSTHFASSGGGKQAAAKATELADDFDFDFFEQEASKPVEPKVVDSRKVEDTYGLPTGPTPAQAPSGEDKPQVFGFAQPDAPQPAAQAPAAPVAVSASLSMKKGFGAAMFGHDEPRSSDRAEKVAQYVDKGQELARAGAEKLKGYWEKYMQK